MSTSDSQDKHEARSGVTGANAASMRRPGLRAGARLRRVGAAFAFLLIATSAIGQSQTHPLKPPDRSSPRATLKTFLQSADALGAFIATEYVHSPSYATKRRAFDLGRVAVGCLDLSTLAPAARLKASSSGGLALYEVLSRIELPPFDQIPGAGEVEVPPGGGPPRWVIPNTEIALVRMQSGPQVGEYLFSADTVERAVDFYERVRHLPYVRSIPFANMYDLSVEGGGWMIPYAWVQTLPAWLHDPLGEHPTWKWIGLVLILLATALFLWMVNHVSRLGNDRHPFLRALAQLTMPASLLAAVPVFAFLTLEQLNLTGQLAVAINIAATAIMFLASAWMFWRLSPVIAEAIISSPGITSESIDAHLIRVSMRLLGIVGSAALLALGADRMGLPVYGVVAGLGVGGLAIALAAQPTLENLIGGLNLFADKPIRVGDFCKYGSDLGTIESIGIRSTRIRGLGRTLTTIPNAMLAKMPIENFTWRDRMLLRADLGLRYETTPEQLRYVLVRLRELLLGHPRVDPDPARARFAGFGESSLNIEVFAYVTTNDWNEFLGIREDILLRVMDIIEQAGTAVAFPSQTLYLGRDHGADEGKVEAVESSVRAWREEGALPFPDFSPEQAAKVRGSIVFPPPGSPQAASGSSPGPKSPPHEARPDESEKGPR